MSRTIANLLTKSDLIAIAEENADAEVGLPTPLIPITRLAALAGKIVLAKYDNQTISGSYKLRGVLHAVRQTSPWADAYVCASTGNHAGAVCDAAGIYKMPVVVVVPKATSLTKVEKIILKGIKHVVSAKLPLREIERLLRHGESVLVMVDGGFDAAQAFADRLAEALAGAVLIHPFNDEYGFIGHASIGVELLAQLDAQGLKGKTVRLVFPAGGGGYSTSALLGAIVCGIPAALTICEMEGQACCNYAISHHHGSADGPMPLPLGVTDAFVGSTAVGRMGSRALQVATQYGVDSVVVGRNAVREAFLQLPQLLAGEPQVAETRVELAVGLTLAGLLATTPIEEDVVVMAVSGANIGDAELKAVQESR